MIDLKEDCMRWQAIIVISISNIDVNSKVIYFNGKSLVNANPSVNNSMQEP